MSTHARRIGRELALQAIYCLQINYQTLDELIQFAWLDSPATGDADGNDQESTRARQFAILLVTGVYNEVKRIDTEIKSHATNWNINRLLQVDKAVLRISIYALLFLKDIPVSVTINEAIELVKQYSESKSAGFINGVLDTVAKRQAASPATAPVPTPAPAADDSAAGENGGEESA